MGHRLLETRIFNVHAIGLYAIQGEYDMWFFQFVFDLSVVLQKVERQVKMICILKFVGSHYG